jgi:gliding motility-associated-like protein
MLPFMRLFLGSILLFVYTTIVAQTKAGLVAYYPFNKNLKDDTGNLSNDAIGNNAIDYVCGPLNESLRFSGNASLVNIIGAVNSEFDTEDFSVSFYFKIGNDKGIQYLLSKKRRDCLVDNSFVIRFRPLTGNLNIVLTEGVNKQVNMIYELPKGKCWHHITLLRTGTKIRLYYNGSLVSEQTSVSRVNVLNDGNLVVGGSTCYGANEIGFNGLMDDLRFYNRALLESEIEKLYQPVDQIINDNEIVYIGDDVVTKLSPTCATEFNWTPKNWVDNPALKEPVITPTASGTFTYKLTLKDASTPCIAEDSFRIVVIDPNGLNCNETFLPNAFTPNGDGLNDVFGISNPRIITALISFEIWDRWGNKMFNSSNVNDQWDGTFNGQIVSPGVYRVLILHQCKGAIVKKATTVMVMN